MAGGGAEYPLGVNHIVYKAEQFQTGLTVTCTVRDPATTAVADLALDELGDGLYTFEFDFKELGIYCGVFFEGGEPKRFASFRIVFGTFRP